MPARRGLGNGLDALIPKAKGNVQPSGEKEAVKVKEVVKEYE